VANKYKLLHKYAGGLTSDFCQVLKLCQLMVWQQKNI